MPGFLLLFNLAFLGEHIVTLKNTFFGTPCIFYQELEEQHQAERRQLVAMHQQRVIAR